MTDKAQAYLFGQILGTHSFLLKGGFLQPDEYSEIQEQYFLFYKLNILGYNFSYINIS